MSFFPLFEVYTLSAHGVSVASVTLMLLLCILDKYAIRKGGQKAILVLRHEGRDNTMETTHNTKLSASVPYMTSPQQRKKNIKEHMIIVAKHVVVVIYLNTFTFPRSATLAWGQLLSVPDESRTL